MNSTFYSIRVDRVLISLAVLLAIAATLSSPGSAQTSEYTVGVDDVLKITVSGRSDYRLTEEIPVSPSGGVTLSIMKEPFIVEGMTIDEIDLKLTGFLAAHYLYDPQVTVEVAKYVSKKILVIGEVKNPGEIALQKNSISLKELMIQTGGPIGDINKTLVILREENQGSVDPMVVNLDEMLMSTSQDQVTIKGNDVVYIIGKDKNLPVSDLNNVIYVFGEVTKPGLVPFSQNMTVLRAIISAGNFTKEAAPSRTNIKRRINNKITTLSADMEKVMSGGDKTQDLTLQPGDMIYVPRAIF